MTSHRHFELSLPPGTGAIAPAVDKVQLALDAAITQFGEHPVLLACVSAFDKLLAAYGSETHSAPRTAREARFWARTYQKGPHIIWTGMGRDRPGGIPICDWITPEGKTIRTTAARVAYLLETRRDIPDGRYLKQLCEEPRCIAPRCHEINVSYSAGRRPSAYYYDADGKPRCRLGHSVKEPPPGKSIYCPTCYQLGRAALRAAQAAAENARARTRGIQRVPVVHNDPPEWQALMARESRFVDWLAEAHPDANPLDLTTEQEDRFQREYKQSLPPSGSDSKPSQPAAPTDAAFLDEINAMFDEAGS